MDKRQLVALETAVRRFGKERVLKTHKSHQYTIDEWRCDLRPLNNISLREMEALLNEQ